MNVAAVILAAGCSQRMGERNKLLQTISNKAMIRWVAEAVTQIPFSSTIVVTGYESEKIHSCLSDLHCQYIHNSHYSSGIASSLKTGINTLKKQDGALILLADMPFIKTTHLNIIVAAINQTEAKKIVVPTNAGRRGNPVFWPKHYFPEIMLLRDDVGARALLARYASEVCEVNVETDAIFIDIDTPQVLEELLSNATGEQ